MSRTPLSSSDARSPSASHGGVYQSLVDGAEWRRLSENIGSDDDDDGHEDGPRVEAVQLAAAYIRAAMFDRRIDHKTDAKSLRYVKFYYENRSFRGLIMLALVGYVLITFFENRDGTEPFWTYVAEAACWLILVIGFMIRVRFSSLNQLFRSKFAVLHFVSLLIAGIDMAVSFYCWRVAEKPYFRYARVVRPILQLEYSPMVRRRAIDILDTTYRVRGALLLLAFQITFFAVVSMFLFYGTKEGEMYFSTMGDSLVNLIILLSTCNSPKIMFPAFKMNPWSALYFCAYMIVSVLLMLNVVLAVVYNEHRRHLKEAAKRMAVRKRVCTSAAYRVMFLEARRTSHATVSYDDGLPYDLARDLLVELGVEESHAEIFTQLLDSENRYGRQRISRDDFEDILLVVHFTVDNPEPEDENDALSIRERAESASGNDAFDTQALIEEQHRRMQERNTVSFAPSSFGQAIAQGEFQYREKFNPERDGVPGWLCGVTRKTSQTGLRRLAIKMVTHHTYAGPWFGFIKTLDFTVNSLLVTSGIITIVTLAIDPKVVVDDDPAPFKMFNAICSIFFAVEIAARVYAFTPRYFFESYWNTFEFTVVLASFMGVVCQFSSWQFFSRNHHLFLFIRKLRLLRLLRSVPQFRLLIEMIAFLVPAMNVFARVIFTFMYIYAIIGMGLFNFELPAPYYVANDFRTFAHSLLTLFELMMVNDWNATMGAFYAYTGDSFVHFFFIFWYIFAVIILLNSVTSFALEALDKNITNLLRNLSVEQSIEGSPALTYQGNQSGQSIAERELKRSMSYSQRFDTLQKMGRVVKNKPQESHIVKLLRDVFNDEMDEPTTAEIDAELQRLGLEDLEADRVA